MLQLWPIIQPRSTDPALTHMRQSILQETKSIQYCQAEGFRARASNCHASWEGNSKEGRNGEIKRSRALMETRISLVEANATGSSTAKYMGHTAEAIGKESSRPATVQRRLDGETKYECLRQFSWSFHQLLIVG